MSDLEQARVLVGTSKMPTPSKADVVARNIEEKTVPDERGHQVEDSTIEDPVGDDEELGIGDRLTL